jgi:hypothetical protein
VHELGKQVGTNGNRPDKPLSVSGANCMKTPATRNHSRQGMVYGPSGIVYSRKGIGYAAEWIVYDHAGIVYG